MKRINTDVISRLIVCALMMYAPFTWFVSYDSLAAKMDYTQPDRGATIVILMIILSVSILIDVIFNSILDCRIKWDWARRHRDMLYVAGAFSAVTVLFSVGKYVYLSNSSSYLYIILFAACAALGVIDSYAKRPFSGQKLERRKFIRESK